MACDMNITLTSGGKTIELGSGKSIGIIDYKGIEASDYSLSWQDNAQLDGSMLAGRQVKRRSIYIRARYKLDDSLGVMHRWILSFFDPKMTGTATITYKGVTRTIAYEVAGMQILNKSLYAPLDFDVDIVCPQPYLLGDTFYRNMANVSKLFAFPLVFPPSKLVTGYKEFRREAPMQNPGDKAVGLTFEIVARRGPAINPKMLNLSTGQYIRVVTDMDEGDVLMVCTVPGSKRVELNGVNAIQHIDRNSTFFSLGVGETILKYDADGGYTNLDVYPRYTPEYLGV